MNRSSRRKEALAQFRAPRSALRTPHFKSEPPYVGCYEVYGSRPLRLGTVRAPETGGLPR